MSDHREDPLPVLTEREWEVLAQRAEAAHEDARVLERLLLSTGEHRQLDDAIVDKLRAILSSDAGPGDDEPPRSRPPSE